MSGWSKTPSPLLLGTGNRKKLEELKTLLAGIPFKLLTLQDFPHAKDVVEDGETFEANAIKKATGLARQTGLLTLAEDSGLCVEALEGSPGVYSARFAGPEKDDLKNCQKVLALMKNLPDNCRGASFRSSVAMATPERVVGVTEGEVRGAISQEMRGSGGFGYDPIFIYGPYGKTLAEVSTEMKHRVSHRAQAIDKAKKILEDYVKMRTSAGA